MLKHLDNVYSSGLSLEWVPRVPGTRKILSFYVMAPVNFYKIPEEQLPGTRKVLTLLISGTRGLIFLTRALPCIACLSYVKFNLFVLIIWGDIF